MPASITDTADADLPPLRHATQVRQMPPDMMRLAIRYVRHGLIEPDPQQPRQEADAALRDLIKVNGILEPITVRPHPDPDKNRKGHFLIVFGERRWQGANGVMQLIPVIVRGDLDEDARRLATQLAENDHRPLTPLEEARTLFRIMELEHLNIRQLAEYTGRARSTVHDRLVLLEFGPWLTLIEEGSLSVHQSMSILAPFRNAPRAVHERAIAAFLDSPQWQPLAQKRSHGAMSNADLTRMIVSAYQPFLYPLEPSPMSSTPLAFDVSDHSDTCECGGIRSAALDGRLHCANPEYWRSRVAAHQESITIAGDSTFDAAGMPELSLPECAAVAEEREVADGAVVLLTNAAGQWRLQGTQGSIARGSAAVECAYDPRDLGLTEDTLVVVPKQRATDPCDRIATRDRAAVERAELSWTARWRSRYEILAADYASRIAAPKHASLLGQAPALAHGILAIAAAHDGKRVHEVAHVLGISLREATHHPLDATSNAPCMDGVRDACAALQGADAARLAACLVAAFGDTSPLPADQLRAEQGDAIAEIRAHPIPSRARAAGAHIASTTTPENAPRRPASHDVASASRAPTSDDGRASKHRGRTSTEHRGRSHRVATGKDAPRASAKSRSLGAGSKRR